MHDDPRRGGRLAHGRDGRSEEDESLLARAPDGFYGNGAVERDEAASSEIAAAAWGKVTPEDAEALAGGTFAELAKVLDAYPDSATVAVVGHEPHVSDLLGRPVGSRASDRLAFKKGGAALVDVKGRLAEGGELVWFLSPKVLRKL